VRGRRRSRPGSVARASRRAQALHLRVRRADGRVLPDHEVPAAAPTTAPAAVDLTHHGVVGAVVAGVVLVGPGGFGGGACRAHRFRGQDRADRRCSGRWWSTAWSSWSRSWAWTRPGSGGRGGCLLGCTTTAGSVGCGRIRGRPGSSTSPVTSRWLGQLEGRTSAAVQAWLAARNRQFRAGIEVVVIDPHAGYAAAVRAALPDASRWTTSI